MKKGLIIFGAFLCLLIITMIAIPFAFKGKFSQKIKLAANETVNAKVDFSEIELSLFRSFPQLNVELKNITVTGVNEFDNINLLSLESLSTSINISGLWKSDELIVTSLNFNRPSVNLLVNKVGKSNWDIAKPKADKKVTADKKVAAEMKNTFIDLEKILIRNASFSFSSEETLWRNFGSFSLPYRKRYPPFITSITASISSSPNQYAPGPGITTSLFKFIC